MFINGNNEIAWFLTGLKINETCPSRTLHKIWNGLMSEMTEKEVLEMKGGIWKQGAEGEPRGRQKW